MTLPLETPLDVSEDQSPIVETEPSASGRLPLESYLPDTKQRAQQSALLNVLAEKSAAMATMYVGALRVRSDEGNPDAIALVCHGIRELINHIPRHFKIDSRETGQLGSKVRELAGAWEREPRANGQADADLSASFIADLDTFFKWNKENQPNREALHSEMIQMLDISGRSIPVPIMRHRAQEWSHIRDFFVQRAHHKSCTIEELDSWIDHFELFVLALAKPRTFERQDALDVLIAEGESR